MDIITKDTACFFTQQLFLIGTHNEDASANFAPISWISYTGGPPCCLVISINGRDHKKRTALNFERTGLLSATVVTPDLLPFAEQHHRATHTAGTQVNPAIIRGKLLDVPLLDQAVWSYECELFRSVVIGDCTTYYAAIKQINIRKDLQDLPFIDLRTVNPIIYSPMHYFTVGDHLGAIGDFAEHKEE